MIIAGYPRPANGLVQEFMRSCCQDLTYAFRQLRRTPIFTAVAVATLALAIGAAPPLFTVVDSVLLRPLGFAEPQRLTMVRPTSGSRLSAAYLHDWRLESRTFDDMAGWHDVRANLTGGGAPVEVLADRATANFFAVLGTCVVGAPSRCEANLSAQVAPEVVLSHGFWQRRYGTDPDVIGQPITLDGEAFDDCRRDARGFTVRTTELAESRAGIFGMPLPLGCRRPHRNGGRLNVVGRLTSDATVDPGADGAWRDCPPDRRARTPPTAATGGVHRPSSSRGHRKGCAAATAGAPGRRGDPPAHRVRQCREPCAHPRRRTAGGAGHPVLTRRDAATALVRQLLTESVVLAMLAARSAWCWRYGEPNSWYLVPAGVGVPRTHEIGIDTRILGSPPCDNADRHPVWGVPRAITRADAAHRDAPEAIRLVRHAAARRRRAGHVGGGARADPSRRRRALGRSFWELTGCILDSSRTGPDDADHAARFEVRHR